MRKDIQERYLSAKEKYKRIGVDTEEALKALAEIPISLQCWQGDDVQGFVSSQELTGGIQVTGNYRGRARNFSELTEDLKEAFTLLPGKKRLNLHAIYTSRPLNGRDIDQIEVEDYRGWIYFAKQNGIGLDFNPTCFSHPKMKDGLTLTSPDPAIRSFWIDHCSRCLEIGAEFGKELDDRCVTNIWIPDGMKDTPYNHLSYRKRLTDSLDQILKTPYDKKREIVAVESKFFGIGAESYTAGSNEFYLGYAAKNQIALCLDSGHFHPNEFISDKLSSALFYVPEILLHISRPVNWDSDHVVVFDDELQRITNALVREELLSRTNIGLDFFDATINRIAAWTIGTRAVQKALLKSLLEPKALLNEAEENGDYTTRILLTENLKAYPWADVYEYYLASNGVLSDEDYYSEIKRYEEEILKERK